MLRGQGNSPDDFPSDMFVSKVQHLGMRCHHRVLLGLTAPRSTPAKLTLKDEFLGSLGSELLAKWDEQKSAQLSRGSLSPRTGHELGGCGRDSQSMEYDLSYQGTATCTEQNIRASSMSAQYRELPRTKGTPPKKNTTTATEEGKSQS